MSTLPLCRVCLSNNAKLCSVNNILTNVYEKLTDSEYNTAGYPLSLCYICLTVLQKCHRFMETARDTNKLLKQWYNQHVDTKVIKARPLHSLNITSTSTTDTTTDGEHTIEISPVVVKKENILYERDDQEQEKEVIIEFEKLDTAGTHNVEYNLETTHDTDTTEHNIDSDNETKPLAYHEEWLEETPVHSEGNDYDIPMQSSSKFQPKKETARQSASSQYDEEETGVTQKPSTSQKDRFSCTICPKNYKYKKNLKLHYENIHSPRKNSTKPSKKKTVPTSNKRFSCKICHKDYKFKKSLTDHYDTMHSRNKPFACTLCPYKTAVSCHFKEHAITHSVEKDYACKECDFRTTRLRSLKHHNKKHTNERNFHCQLCSKKYIQNCELQKHIKAIHSKETPFSCNLCPYTSFNKVHLVDHVSCVHLKEKPFQCDICKRQFSAKNGVRHHLKTHYRRPVSGIYRPVSEERPFACPICQNGFRNKKNIATHMRIHTGERPFPCNLCDYKATQKFALKKHLRRVHKLEESQIDLGIGTA